jgi:outer membrane lipoprotein-sorting protein
MARVSLPQLETALLRGLKSTAALGLFTVFAMAGVANAQASAADPQARALLERMQQAEHSLRVSGIQETTVTRSGKVIKSEERVVRDGDRAIRTEYLSPPKLVGEVLIDNGKVFWHYIPAKQIMETGPSHFDHMRGHLRRMLHRLDAGELTAQASGRDMVAGRRCEIVDVASHEPDRQRHWRFWIDSDTGAQIGIEMSDAQRGWTSTTRYRSVRFNPAIDARAFAEPVVPGSVRIVAHASDDDLKSPAEVQKRAGFPVGVPGYLPPGYAFQSGRVTHFGDRKGAALRYAAGDNVLSLFQFVARHPSENEAIAHPNPDVATMQRSGIRLVLVGNIDPAEAEKILLSVR